MANLEVIALDTVTPQLKAPQAGDGYVMPRPVTVTEVVGSSALTLTGATQTTSQPVLNATQTWNNVATTFTGIKFNVTNTASNAASLLMDLQVGGASRVSISNTATIILDNGASGNAQKIVLNPAIGVSLRSDKQLAWTTSTASSTLDAYITRKAAASLQLGLADAAAPVAQTFGGQSVVAGTSNTAGAAFTIRGSQGTGTGVGGNILFQVAPAGTAGTAQNALVTQMTISSGGITSAAGTDFVSNGNFQLPGTFQIRATSNLRIAFPSDGVVTLLNWASTSFGRIQFGGTTSSFPALKRSTTIVQVRLADDSAYAPLEASTLCTATAYTVATLPAAGTAGRRAYVTDATLPTFLGALTGGGAVVTPVFDDGTAWVAG
jgi:hypothetical protein